jgi:hypothetical protein
MLADLDASLVIRYGEEIRVPAARTGLVKCQGIWGSRWETLRIGLQASILIWMPWVASFLVSVKVGTWG